MSSSSYVKRRGQDTLVKEPIIPVLARRAISKRYLEITHHSHKQQKEMLFAPRWVIFIGNLTSQLLGSNNASLKTKRFHERKRLCGICLSVSDLLYLL